MYPSPHDLEKKIPSVPDDQQQDSEPLLEVKEHRAANVEIVSALDNVEGNSPEQSCFERFCRGLLFVLCSALAIIPLFWPFYWKVLNQYQRAVLFRFGELQRPARGPGLLFFVPLADDWTIVSLRIRTINVPPQEMLTRDSVTVTVDAVIYFRVRDAVKSVLAVQSPTQATALLAQTILRSVIGESELDSLLMERTQINQKVMSDLEDATNRWGVEVVAVEVKDVLLPKNMQRAMGAQAEAERERRAKVINAAGELEMSEAMLKAANVMSQNKVTMQLRALQTLNTISSEKNSTIVFPLPLDLIAPLVTNALARPSSEHKSEVEAIGAGADEKPLAGQSIPSGSDEQPHKGGTAVEMQRAIDIGELAD